MACVTELTLFLSRSKTEALFESRLTSILSINGSLSTTWVTLLTHALQVMPPIAYCAFQTSAADGFDSGEHSSNSSIVASKAASSIARTISFACFSPSKTTVALLVSRETLTDRTYERLSNTSVMDATQALQVMPVMESCARNNSAFGTSTILTKSSFDSSKSSWVGFGEIISPASVESDDSGFALLKRGYFIKITEFRPRTRLEVSFRCSVHLSSSHIFFFPSNFPTQVGSSRSRSSSVPLTDSLSLIDRRRCSAVPSRTSAHAALCRSLGAVSTFSMSGWPHSRTLWISKPSASRASTITFESRALLWRIVTECEMMEIETEEGLGNSASKACSILCTQEGHCRFEMNTMVTGSCEYPPDGSPCCSAIFFAQFTVTLVRD